MAEAVEASAAAICGELALVVILILSRTRDDDFHVSDRGVNSTRSARHTCSSFVLLRLEEPVRRFGKQLTRPVSRFDIIP